MGRIAAQFDIFDLAGRNVAVLIDEEKPAGSYTATWDASGFRSGIYISGFRRKISWTQRNCC